MQRRLRAYSDLSKVENRPQSLSPASHRCLIGGIAQTKQLLQQLTTHMAAYKNPDDHTHICMS